MNERILIVDDEPWVHEVVSATTPLDTLKARYAHGEIDQEEFDRRLRALGGTT